MELTELVISTSFYVEHRAIIDQFIAEHADLIDHLEVNDKIAFILVPGADVNIVIDEFFTTMEQNNVLRNDTLHGIVWKL